jgi:hypothetical protein
MMRYEVQIWVKFWQYNSVVLQLHTQNGAAENIEVMLPKFWLDLNQASHHKNTLLITLRLSIKGTIPDLHASHAKRM